MNSGKKLTTMDSAFGSCNIKNYHQKERSFSRLTTQLESSYRILTPSENTASLLMEFMEQKENMKSEESGCGEDLTSLMKSKNMTASLI